MKGLIALMTLVVLVSCSNRSGIPNDVIPPDSMKMIMKDIIMASQYSVQHLPKDTLIKDKVKANQELMEKVFIIHHINREAFKHSLLFYESRPDLNKKVFDSLSAYANRQQKEMYRPKPLTKPAVPAPAPPRTAIPPVK